MSPEQTIKIFTIIKDGTFQTGSMAYGCAAPKDHDRFCTPIVLASLKNELSSAGVKVDNGGESGGTSHSIRFNCGGEEFNVFAVPEDQIAIVKATTEMVTIAVRAFNAWPSQKSLWIHLFRTIRDTLTMWKKMKEGAA